MFTLKKLMPAINFNRIIVVIQILLYDLFFLR